LIKELGGVHAVKRTSLEQLQQLSWLPDSVAAAVHQRLHGDADDRAERALSP
jgi:excinuclease ABC subunit C